MATSKTNPKVDAFIANAKKWQEEFKRLRAILLDSELTEEFKWGGPCYTFQGKNVVIINGLKESCALAFFKGALLKDVHGVLTRPGQHTQSARWLKFISVREIGEMKSLLKAYIREAHRGRKIRIEIEAKKDVGSESP